MFLRFGAFYMAFIFIVPPLAAVSAHSHAAEMVLLLYLLTIFSFLRALQLEHARTSSITVGCMAGSTLIVRRTTVEKIGGHFTFGGGSLSHVLQQPTRALPRVTVGLTGPPSRTLLSRGLPAQMFAQILVHVGDILPLHGQFNQQIDQVIVRVRLRLTLGRLSTVISCPGKNLLH